MIEAPSSFREAHARLAAAQKGHARGAPAYSVYVNRRVGRLLAAIAHARGATPDQVTGISAIHTFLAIGILALAPMHPWTGVVVALLLALGYAWDSADGQVARLRGGGSVAGEWLDHFVDALKLVLEMDPLVQADQIHVSCRDYVVTLEGVARTEEELRQAEFDAWCIFAVDDVVNRIEVIA